MTGHRTIFLLGVRIDPARDGRVEATNATGEAMMMRMGLVAGATALALTTAAQAAHAFCGFYVSGSGAKLSNDATQVVLMRQGTRTVLSMQNDYKGPLEDFAMVVPVPVVLKQAEVKTLSEGGVRADRRAGRAAAGRVLGAGPVPQRRRTTIATTPPRTGWTRPACRCRRSRRRHALHGARRTKVTIEAKFEVGEYQILILSATEAAGLETWLQAEPLQDPRRSGAAAAAVRGGGVEVLRGEGGSEEGADGGQPARALSPLRFHYDSEEFALPIRLGMANANGKQDLIINILSADKRYEVANYKNVMIPTNFDVRPAVKTRFAEFYAALFDKTMEANPGAVVTEYAWTAHAVQLKCDPCPDQVPADADMMTLGGDIVGGRITTGNYVLTRLHARYGQDGDMKDDLRFREAKAVTGGREIWTRRAGHRVLGATPSAQNFFQARYAIPVLVDGADQVPATPRRARVGWTAGRLPPAAGDRGVEAGVRAARPDLGAADGEARSVGDRASRRQDAAARRRRRSRRAGSRSRPVKKAMFGLGVLGLITWRPSARVCWRSAGARPRA